MRDFSTRDRGFPAAPASGFRGLLTEAHPVVVRGRRLPTTARGAPLAAAVRDVRDAVRPRVADEPGRDRPTAGRRERGVERGKADLVGQPARDRGGGDSRTGEREPAAETGGGLAGQRDRQRTGFGLPLRVGRRRATALHPLRGDGYRQGLPTVDPGERAEERRSRVAGRLDLGRGTPTLRWALLEQAE